MEHPTDAKIIVEKAMLASRARSAAKKQERLLERVI